MADTLDSPTPTTPGFFERRKADFGKWADDRSPKEKLGALIVTIIVLVLLQTFCYFQGVAPLFWAALAALLLLAKEVCSVVAASKEFKGNAARLEGAGLIFSLFAAIFGFPALAFSLAG